MDRCVLARIRSKDPWNSLSLCLLNVYQITSLASMANLTGSLTGALLVQGSGLVTLEGLEGVGEVGPDYSGSSIFLHNNPALRSAVAIGGASYPVDSLFVTGNTALTCVPIGWPMMDRAGNAIPGRERPCP
jgi:hypothetical protein